MVKSSAQVAKEPYGHRYITCNKNSSPPSVLRHYIQVKPLLQKAGLHEVEYAVPARYEFLLEGTTVVVSNQSRMLPILFELRDEDDVDSSTSHLSITEL